MLEINTIERFNEVSKNRVIVIIGAGITCKNFLNKTNNNDNANIIICDNNVELQETGVELNGYKHKIFALELIKEMAVDNVVVVIAAKDYSNIYAQLFNYIDKNTPIFVYPFIETREVQYKKQIKQCLSDYYYHNHYDLKYRDKFIENEYEKLEKNGGMVIPYLPIYLTTKCTLNCDKCNNLMPYLKENSKNADFSLEKIQKSLTYVLDCVQEITFCELVGGEPFLYRDFNKILEYVGESKKIRQIVVVTNGTICPAESTLELLKKYNVLVRISDYGMFEKMSQLVVILERYGINVRVLQDMRWNDPGDIDGRGKSKEELYFQYNSCIFSLRCKYLCEDKLFTCARIASLYLLGKYTGEEDFLNINSALSEDELYEFYMSDIGNGCDYCDLCSITGADEIPAALQKGKKQIDHSLYTIIRNDYLDRLKKNQKR